MISSFPLSWPSGWKRYKDHQRVNGRFKTDRRWITVSDGVGRILAELSKLGIDRQEIVISTNVKTRLDGLPRSGDPEPKDPGAAAYWRKNATAAMQCMAIDRYTTVADNLGAVAATLEAMRAIERHGGAEILDRAFTGFAALPESTSKPWREVLGFEAEAGGYGVAEVEARFKLLARKHHPDVGGDEEKFKELTEARTAAIKELSQ